MLAMADSLVLFRDYERSGVSVNALARQGRISEVTPSGRQPIAERNQQ